MKKVIIGALCCLFCMGITISANAQLPSGTLGKAVGKAAQKLATATVNKIVDTVEKKAENAMGLNRPAGNANPAQSRTTADFEGNPEENTYRQGRVNVTNGGTYGSISEVMAAAPALPTAKELMTYKEATLNGSKLQLITSPVTRFISDMASLSMTAMEFAYGETDTAQMEARAYQALEKSTGLTKADLQKMENMSEAEQEAYLRQHHVTAKAQTSTLQQVAELTQYMAPVEAQIGQWGEINSKIDALYAQLETTQKAAYEKFASQLSAATGKARNAVLAKYYGEFVEAQRNTVMQAMQLRLKEQMPIAEEIEKYMSGIRAEHPDISFSLINYPQLTQTSYFSETSHLLDLPEF